MRIDTHFLETTSVAQGTHRTVINVCRSNTHQQTEGTANDRQYHGGETLLALWSLSRGYNTTALLRNQLKLRTTLTKLSKFGGRDSSAIFCFVNLLIELLESVIHSSLETFTAYLQVGSS